MKHMGYAAVEELTGIKRGTLYSMVSQKKIPHIRLGKRHVLFQMKELQEWLEQHRAVSLDQVKNGEKND